MKTPSLHSWPLACKECNDRGNRKDKMFKKILLMIHKKKIARQAKSLTPSESAIIVKGLLHIM